MYHRVMKPLLVAALALTAGHAIAGDVASTVAERKARRAEEKAILDAGKPKCEADCKAKSCAIPIVSLVLGKASCNCASCKPTEKGMCGKSKEGELFACYYPKNHCLAKRCMIKPGAWSDCVPCAAPKPAP